MRKMTGGLVIVALTLGVATLVGHGEEPKKDDPKADEKKVKELMHKKLEASQKVLEGLATNDLDKVGKNAEELARIRKEASFRIIPTAEYDLWSDEFTRSVEGIKKAAKDKNLEAAKLGYLSMTLSCFNCHTYVRDQKRVSIDTDFRP
jgi:hypothetical protein